MSKLYPTLVEQLKKVQMDLLGTASSLDGCDGKPLQTVLDYLVVLAVSTERLARLTVKVAEELEKQKEQPNDQQH